MLSGFVMSDLKPQNLTSLKQQQHGFEKNKFLKNIFFIEIIKSTILPFMFFLLFFIFRVVALLSGEAFHQITECTCHKICNLFAMRNVLPRD